MNLRAFIFVELLDVWRNQTGQLGNDTAAALTKFLHSGRRLLHQLAAEVEAQKDSWPNAQFPSW